MRESKIQYNPSLTVKENAKRNGVTEAAIRYYIKVNHLDRRFDRKQNIIEDCRKYLKKHPNASKTELHKKTGHSLSTIYQYWEYIATEKEFSDFDSEKTQKRKLRQLNNFYATHPSCTSDILREEDFCKDILEPFCGVGTMSEVIKHNGHNVVSYDIVDRGYGQVGDFYHTEFPRRKYDIITNPPYDNVITLVLRCLEICKDKVALLMPLRYLSSSSRYNELYKKYPPARVYVYQERICIAKNADFKKYSDAGANLEIYGWYIWERGYKGATELRWISNDKKVVDIQEPQPVKALILDFDMTLFDTSADNEVRKNKKGKEIDWNEVYSVIPQYRLYDGWREVFAWAKENSIKIAIVSTAQGELIRRTLEHFNLSCDTVIGWNLYHKKPSGKLVDIAVEKMGVNKENVISIGDSIVDKQMSDNGGVKFYGALWDSTEEDYNFQEPIISTPLDIISIKSV